MTKPNSNTAIFCVIYVSILVGGVLENVTGELNNGGEVLRSRVRIPPSEGKMLDSYLAQQRQLDNRPRLSRVPFYRLCCAELRCEVDVVFRQRPDCVRLLWRSSQLAFDVISFMIWFTVASRPSSLELAQPITAQESSPTSVAYITHLNN